MSLGLFAALRECRPRRKLWVSRYEPLAFMCGLENSKQERVEELQQVTKEDWNAEENHQGKALERHQAEHSPPAAWLPGTCPLVAWPLSRMVPQPYAPQPHGPIVAWAHSRMAP